MRVALDFEVGIKRKQGQSIKTRKKQVEEETEKIGKKEDALNQAKWRHGVQIIVQGIGCVHPSLLRGQYWIRK